MITLCPKHPRAFHTDESCDLKKLSIVYAYVLCAALEPYGGQD